MNHPHTTVEEAAKAGARVRLAFDLAQAMAYLARPTTEVEATPAEVVTFANASPASTWRQAMALVGEEGEPDERVRLACLGALAIAAGLIVPPGIEVGEEA